MSAAEPDWLTAMRSTIDRATTGGWWWCGYESVDDGRGTYEVLASEADYENVVASTGPDDRQRADAAHIAEWCPDNARRFLVAHDQLRADAGRMADALDGLTDDHHDSPGGDVCATCSYRWPCPTARAVEALGAYREHQGDG